MRLEINGLQVEALGDPHLGKKFVNGVPLHRRGEREAMVWRDFRASLAKDCDLHVTMGDMFDKAVVPFSVILDAAMAYRTAATISPHTQYVILMGNHDGSRDADFRSAFDVFAALVQDIANLHVVRQSATIIAGLAFCPWDPFVTAEAMIADVPDDVAAVFGHWDIIDVARQSHNFLPVEWLSKRPNVRVFTGHDHKARVERVNGVTVNIIGSMQPFAHGEDADDQEPLYRTLTLAELECGEPERFINKCVRLDLKPGETPPDLDCLQLTTRRITEEGEPEELTVAFDSFDMEGLFKGALGEAGVPDEIGALVLTRYLETRLKDAE